jgi:hypothetical protein
MHRNDRNGFRPEASENDHHQLIVQLANNDQTIASRRPCFEVRQPVRRQVSEVEIVFFDVREPLWLVPDDPYNLSTPKIGGRQ